MTNFLMFLNVVVIVKMYYFLENSIFKSENTASIYRVH